MLLSVLSQKNVFPTIKADLSSTRLEDKKTDLYQKTPLSSRKIYKRNFQSFFQNVSSEAELKAYCKSIGLDYQAQIDILPTIRTFFIAPSINPLYFERQFGRSEPWQQIYLLINYFNQSPVDIAKDKALKHCINADFVFAWHLVAEIYYPYDTADLTFKDLRLIPMNLFKDGHPQTVLLPKYLEKTLYNIAGLLKPIENPSMIPPSTEPIILQLAINKKEVENIIRSELPELDDKETTDFITEKISDISVIITNPHSYKVSMVIGHQVFTGVAIHSSDDPTTLISNTNTDNKIILKPIKPSTGAKNRPTFGFKLRHIENHLGTVE